MRISHAALLCALGWIAACGGGGDGPSSGATARFAAGEARFDRLTARPNTSFAGMPVTGSATYTGEGLVQVTGDSQGATIVGNAIIDAAFDTGTVTGSVDNFAEVLLAGDGSYVDGATIQGRLLLLNGRIGIVRPNDIGGTVSGQFSGGSFGTMTVDGPVAGDFHGTPIAGVIIGSESLSATLGGRSAIGRLVIVAE